ncbi:MAG: FAD-dependent oxidoreductase [Acidobacteriota bacterium]
MAGHEHFDVVIVGSGFAGTILARALHRRGLKVLLVERGRHPRFAIGESTTPLANFALERLARDYELPDLHQLSTHGRWRRAQPQLRCGLKRGFTFLRHQHGKPYTWHADSRLMVAASPDDELADTHWLRSDVDHFLVQRAVAEGVDTRDRTELTRAVFTADGVELESRGADPSQRSKRQHFTADAVVDGSGAGGFLASVLDLEDRSDLIPIRSGLLFAHFEGVQPLEAVAELGPSPYPYERAAVHHLIDEGWMYALPFDHGVVSAGIVLNADAEGNAPKDPQRDPAAAWQQVIDRYPTLAAQFAPATAPAGVHYLPRIQHRWARAAGPRWFLLPHSYAFYDPMFSTGIGWSLLAVERLAALLAGEQGSAEAYGRLLAAEADQIERLIEAAYLAIPLFETFCAVTQLYFATVSFAEVQQRLELTAAEGPPAWSAFLGADGERAELFEAAREKLREGAARDPERFTRWVVEQIAPFNIAGLGDASRQNLYPVDFDALVDGAPRLGLSRSQLQALLPRLRGEV